MVMVTVTVTVEGDLHQAPLQEKVFSFLWVPRRKLFESAEGEGGS